LMAIEAPENPKINHHCEGIRFQCDRVMSMTRDLFEFTKGDTSLHVSQTTTTAFLNQFQSLHEDYLKQTGLFWEITSEPGAIEIDEMRCLRLLQNLVTNAVEALSGNPKGEIHIRGWVENSMFNLAISDNGPGIPDAIRDRVFQPFVTHGKKGGIGLGMAIVNNVVTAHRGNVKLDTSGKGTHFLAQLPQFVAHEVVGPLKAMPAEVIEKSPSALILE